MIVFHPNIGIKTAKLSCSASSSELSGFICSSFKINFSGSWSIERYTDSCPQEEVYLYLSDKPLNFKHDGFNHLLRLVQNFSQTLFLYLHSNINEYRKNSLLYKITSSLNLSLFVVAPHETYFENYLNFISNFIHMDGPLVHVSTPYFNSDKLEPKLRFPALGKSERFFSQHYTSSIPSREVLFLNQLVKTPVYDILGRSHNLNFWKQ